LAALASLCPFPATALPSSPAYTYLKPKTAFAALANLQSEDLTLEEAFPRRKNFSFTETWASDTLTNPMPS
jgi:hypothetical protein